MSFEIPHFHLIFLLKIIWVFHNEHAAKKKMKRANSQLKPLYEYQTGELRGNTAGISCHCHGQQKFFHINLIMISDNALKRTLRTTTRPNILTIKVQYFAEMSIGRCIYRKMQPQRS